MRGIEDFHLGGNLYYIDREEELAKFSNPLGDGFIIKKKYYISHPKRDTYLLESSRFHEYIAKEQLEDISNYLYNELNIKSLEVEDIEGDYFKEFKLCDFVTLKRDNTLEIKWSENKKTKSEYIWIEDFSSLVNKVKEIKALKSNKDLRDIEKPLNYNNSCTLEIDNSFGISEKIGKRIGIKPTYLKKYLLKLTF